MAAAAAKTTTPRRRAAATKSTAPATSAPKATAAKAPAKAATAEDEVQRIQVTLAEPFEETKSYAKFNLKWDADGNDTGMVGTLYAPHGTRTVKILLVGEEIEDAVSE